MKFLVTGGAGFIGSHVVERLISEDHRVTVIDDFNDFYDPCIKRCNLAQLFTRAQSGFELHEIDITDAAAVRGICQSTTFDQVIHLAARAGVRPSIISPALYQRVNVEGTVNIIEEARKAGCHKFILASSSSVYGVNSKVPFSEADPIFKPISPYAASKLACEAIGHTFHHLYGLDVAMLRFFTVYGPRQRPDLAISKFTKAIYKGKPIEVFGDGSTQRDYTYIEDIVDGIMACTKAKLGYEVLNLGESQTVRLDSLISLIETALGISARIDQKPLQPGDVPTTYADISKAVRLLGYAPKTKIHQGIPKFVNWFLQTKDAACH